MTVDVQRNTVFQRAPTKSQLPDETRRRVVGLRRTHSLSQVAKLTGLPVGTVKTLCSRSGAFRDNPLHRAMFTLPPIKVSEATGLSIPEIPAQQAVTGDKEVDAVLWLHSVISTGQAPLIEKAMQAARRIKTPLKELEKRYTAHLAKAHPGNFVAVLLSIGFDDLEGLARRSVETATRKREAHARFGDAVFDDTPAEVFCEEALAGVDECENGWSLDAKQVDSRFDDHPDRRPNTLSDCIHELAYWRELYQLRNAAEQHCGDPSMTSGAREDYAFRCLGRIRARTTAEAISVFRYLTDFDLMDRDETNAILLNLLGARGQAGDAGDAGD